MNLSQSTGVDGPKLLFQSVVSPPPHEEVTQFVETVCQHGECLHLRPQQRVPQLPAGKLIVLREGMLAVDAMPAKEKLQILDFLVTGDVVSASIVLPTPGVSLRAITRGSLACLDPPASEQAGTARQYWTFLIAQCLNQLARVNLHQLMIGRLEAESRVASFLLGLALRNVGGQGAELTVALPMSRTDIANYLVINCDTLSRTMMRFSDCGLIERKSRHFVRITDLEGLRRKSPLSPLLSKVLERASARAGLGRQTERSMPIPSIDPRELAPSVLTNGALPRPRPGVLYASRCR